MSCSDVLEHQRGIIVLSWLAAHQQHEKHDDKETPIRLDSAAVFAQFPRLEEQAELLRTPDYQPVGDIFQDVTVMQGHVWHGSSGCIA